MNTEIVILRRGKSEGILKKNTSFKSAQNALVIQLLFRRSNYSNSLNSHFQDERKDYVTNARWYLCDPNVPKCPCR